MFGESVGETLKEASEEANSTRARTAEAVPGAKEVEDFNLHKCDKQSKRETLVIGIDYMYMRSEQWEDEEKGMPSVVMKDEKTKMIAGGEGGAQQGHGSVRSGVGEKSVGATWTQEDDIEERQRASNVRVEGQ